MIYTITIGLLILDLIINTGDMEQLIVLVLIDNDLHIKILGRNETKYINLNCYNDFYKKACSHIVGINTSVIADDIRVNYLIYQGYTIEFDLRADFNRFANNKYMLDSVMRNWNFSAVKNLNIF